VLKDGKGLLIVRQGGSLNPEDYLPCNYCLGFYSTSALWTHSKSCAFRIGVGSNDTAKLNAVFEKSLTENEASVLSTALDNVQNASNPLISFIGASSDSVTLDYRNELQDGSQADDNVLQMDYKSICKESAKPNSAAQSTQRDSGLFKIMNGRADDVLVEKDTVSDNNVELVNGRSVMNDCATIVDVKCVRMISEIASSENTASLDTDVVGAPNNGSPSISNKFAEFKKILQEVLLERPVKNTVWNDQFVDDRSVQVAVKRDQLLDDVDDLIQNVVQPRNDFPPLSDSLLEVSLQCSDIMEKNGTVVDNISDTGVMQVDEITDQLGDNGFVEGFTEVVLDQMQQFQEKV